MLLVCCDGGVGLDSRKTLSVATVVVPKGDG